MQRRRLAIAALVTLLGVLGIILVQRDIFVDFPVYYHAGRSLISGRTDVYAADFAAGPVMDYRYPPFFITVFGWLALLPQPLAAYLWYWLCILAIAGCVVILHRISKPLLAETETRRPELAVWLIALLMVGPHFVKAIKLGNAHVLMVFLMYGAFYLALRYRDVFAGLLLSLAITIKVTPLFAVAYFIITKRWKLLAAAAVFLVALNIAPAAYFGLSKNTELLQAWYQHIVVNPELHETVGPIDQSLRGVLNRYLTEIDYTRRSVSGDIDYPSINFAAMSPETAYGLWMFFAAAINLAGFGVIWFTSFRKNALRGTEDSAERTIALTAFLALGLVICLKLITVPQTAKPYFIELLWPVVALGTYAFANSHRVASLCRHLLIFLAGSTIVLLLLPGRSIQRFLLVAGVDLYITVLLSAGLAAAMITIARTSLYDPKSECDNSREE